jgi:hypothetical protein
VGSNLGLAVLLARDALLLRDESRDESLEDGLFFLALLELLAIAFCFSLLPREEVLLDLTPPRGVDLGVVDLGVADLEVADLGVSLGVVLLLILLPPLLPTLLIGVLLL